jgi:hypothetical protein
MDVLVAVMFLVVSHVRALRFARPDHQPDQICRETAFGRSFCLEAWCKMAH